MANSTRASLERVVADLGDTFLELLAGDLGGAADPGGAVVYDRHRQQSLPEGAIVLGVGLGAEGEILDALDDLGKQNAAALVVGLPREIDPALRDAVRRNGVVLLGLTAGASWLQLADVVRTILTDDVGEESRNSIGGVPSGDLFALANAVAALVDAPITIEDRRFRVLAFSGRQKEADEARIQTILERQVPDPYIQEDEGRGVFRTLYASDEPIYVEPSQVGSAELPRVAMAVRSGDEILGSIWLAVPGPISAERTQALRDVAPLVALHLLRRRAGSDVDRRLRADLVATALEGGVESQQAVGRLGLLHRQIAVIAMDLLADGGDPSRLVAERQRHSDALAMHLSSMAPRSEVALLGDVVYGLFPLTGDAETGIERVKTITTEFLLRTGSRVSAVIGIGAVVSDATSLHDSRLQADRALRVLRMRGLPGLVASNDDVYVDGLLLELRDLTRSRNDDVGGPLNRLTDYDQRKNTQLVATLRHWLDAFGDVHRAAAAAGVHENTFRYRLKRMSEVSGVDLDDTDGRFALHLRLRLIDTTSE